MKIKFSFFNFRNDLAHSRLSRHPQIFINMFAVYVAFSFGQRHNFKRMRNSKPIGHERIWNFSNLDDTLHVSGSEDTQV